MITIQYKRRKPICQWQIDDYMSIKRNEVYHMNNPRVYQQAVQNHHWIPHRHYARTPKPASCSGSLPKAPLDRFLFFTPTFTVLGYLHYYRMENIEYTQYTTPVIPSWEWDLFQYDPTYHGYFNHLFLLNDFMYFDTFQATLGAKGVAFGKFQLLLVINLC